jgi:hypothetical protein
MITERKRMATEGRSKSRGIQAIKNHDKFYSWPVFTGQPKNFLMKITLWLSYFY